jgi:hypothetical protein
MSKQTAVEFFFSELERMQYFIGNDMLEAYKEAKQMEKEQLLDMGNQFAIMGEDSPEQYYNETYKNK